MSAEWGMSARLDDLKREAATLSDSERAERALGLIESLDEPADEGDIEGAWRIEIDRRSAALACGDVTPIPGDELFARLRDRLG
jgi:putative addiction module component (TIGR02574 family)